MGGMAVHKFSLCFVRTDQWASGNNVWKSEEPLSLPEICHENEEKVDTTEAKYMILVSFFSEDNVLYDEIKTCYIFEYQSNENRAFRFFLGHPVYTGWPKKTGQPMWTKFDQI